MFMQNLQLEHLYYICPHVYRSALDILDTLVLWYALFTRVIFHAYIFRLYNVLI